MTHAVQFSGLESDQFVSFASSLMADGVDAVVEISGREPITSSSVSIVGRPLEARDVGYSRTLLIRTDGGSQFRIGGTNTTKSIACERLVFRGLPASAEVATDETLEQWLSALGSEDEERVIAAVRGLTLGMRTNAIGDLERPAIQVAAMEAMGSPRPRVRIACLGLLGLLGGREALAVLVASLRDESANVRRQAALRLRGMEPIIAENRSDSDAVACVEELIDRLRSDADEAVRIYAAEDLGYFYNDQAVAALASALECDLSTEVRWACTVAIGRSNDVDAIAILQRALRHEENPSIRRAALLGIGRHAADLLLRRPDIAREAAMELAGWIVERPGEGVDYAIHALGEFGEAAAPFLDLVVGLLDSEDIEVIAPTTMSIAKLLPFSDLRQWRDSVLRGLGARSKPPEPTDWPEVGFYRAFLSSAGDLALALEDFALAAELFQTAAEIKDQPDWLCVFNRGAAQYARAEASVACGEPIAAAIELLREALGCFDTVSDSDAFADTDASRSGLRLKQILAEARLAVLSAIQNWNPHLIDKHDIRAMDEQLERANSLYRRLDLTNLSDNEAKLSAQEVALIYSLQLIVGILSEACRLSESLLNHDSDAVRFSLGAVRAQCRRLVERAGVTQSVSLGALTSQLQDILVRTDDGGRAPVEVATEMLDLLPAALSSPAPAPGTCPIVTFGEAALIIAPADATGGTGSQLDPYVVPAGASLIFEGHVYVSRRTKDDELIFTADSRSTPQGDGIQYVPVHEGHYPLRPVEFTPIRESSASRPFAFTLSFRNRGCLQPVNSIELWVRAHSDTEVRPQEVSPESLSAVEGEVTALRERLQELDTALEGARTPALRRRSRELRNEIATKSKLVGEMRERLELIEADAGDAPA